MASSREMSRGMGYVSPARKVGSRMRQIASSSRGSDLRISMTGCQRIEKESLRRFLHGALRQSGIERTGIFPAQNIEGLHELSDAVGLGAQQPELNDFLITEMLREVLVNLILVYGVFALLEQVGIAQSRFLAWREQLAGLINGHRVDHVLGQAFALGNIRANGRAIAALVRDGDLDSAHFFELVRQYALVEHLVPVFDPTGSNFAACHDADDTGIRRAGALGGFDKLAGVGGFLILFDVAQARHSGSPWRLSQG